MSLSVSTTKGARVYRYDAEKFVLMTVPPIFGGVSPLNVLGPDDIWFTTQSNALVHYKDDAWTAVPNSVTPAAIPLSFDASGTVAWSIGGVFEYEGPYTDGIPAKTFVNLQRIENHVATARLGPLPREVDSAVRESFARNGAGWRAQI